MSALIRKIHLEDHMRGILGLTLLAMLAAAPAPVVAQGQTPPPQRETGPRMGGPQEGRPFGLLMENREQLGLTNQQIARLEQIAQRLEQQNGPLLQQLRDAGIPVRPERRDGVRDMTPEQRRALRDRLEAHRPTLMQMRQNTHTAMEEARGVLTPEQQERMRDLMRKRAEQTRGRHGGPDHPRGPRPPGSR
jgi:Spy/CpxP family protein refolding chaperone